MNIAEFINNYKNHPVLFVGTGISLRYLKNSYSWDGLLKKIAYELTGNEEFYLDIKSDSQDNGKYNFAQIASKLEKVFNETLSKDRNGKFKNINDIFYSEMSKDNNLSRFKIYLSELVGDIKYKEEMENELIEIKKIRKNIGSVITTNYDTFVEDIFGFVPLVGNDILLSNPYGSVYKIHGCHKDPSKIIINEEDYTNFNQKYELIRAQLLSIFIHNPIIFIGYSISDDNIKNLLRTIFTYVEPNSAQAKRIRDNFLLVEYDSESLSHDITEHDIDLEGFNTIRINKVKTNDFNEIYKSLSNINLPVSAMDIRKVQSVVRNIFSGINDDGSFIKVNITEDIDSLDNKDKILAIGSKNTITYVHRNTSSFMVDYFDIIEESNNQLLELIDKLKISSNQWFPIFGFSEIKADIINIGILKSQQCEKIKKLHDELSKSNIAIHNSVDEIENDQNIAPTRKINSLFLSVLENRIPLEKIKLHLQSKVDKNTTNYRKLLCIYDIKFYSSK